MDKSYLEIDSLIFFKLFPRVGSINFKNRVIVSTEYTITERAGFPQIMFRFKNNYHTFDELKFDKQSLSFVINNDPEVPVNKEDLKIIRIAKGLLSEEKFWNKEDDRVCDDDLTNKSYSLYCALRVSSLEVEEKYNHRNAVLQKIRHLITKKYPDKKWNHRLMDFNNMKDTEHKDIVNLIEEVEHDILLELSNKK